MKSIESYVTVAQRNAAGQKERESYGTGTHGMSAPLYLKLHYNRRHQMVDLRLGSSSSEWDYDRGALIFYYGSGGVANWNPFQDDTDNNGNVLRQVNYVPKPGGGGDVIPQLDDYTYDSLNRISGMTEWQYDASGNWQSNVVTQSFTYDRYGNRCVSSATGGVSNSCPTYTASTNRVSSGLTYDASGNITYDAATGGTMAYDAENRMVTASSGGTYTYDGEGKRVKRATGGQTWWYVYGFGGELLAEYLSGAPTTVKKEYGYRAGQLLLVWDGDKSGDEQWKWLVQDHLGSTRMESDKSGSLSAMKRHDYAPFGEEMTAGIRQSSGVGQYGYEPPQTNVRQKFTGYERDDETGLDFAQARYYANGQGRFTSCDPLLASGRPVRPQSWNRYAYSYNNPLAYSDPSGMDAESDEERRKKQLEAEKAKIDVLNPGTDYTLVFLGIRSDKPGTATANAITDSEFSGTLGELGFGGLGDGNTSILLNGNGAIAGGLQKADPKQVAMGVELGNYAMEKGLNVHVITHSNGIQGGADFFRQMGSDFKAGNTLTIAPATKQVDDLRVIAEKSNHVTLMTSDKDSVISKPWAPHRSMREWRVDLKAFRNVDYVQTKQKDHGAQFYLREYKAGRSQR